MSNQAKIGNDVLAAKYLLENDEVVAIPTETVYGLAANAFSQDAVSKIYKVKNRPLSNPLIVHVKDKTQLISLSEHIPAFIEILIEKFTPGPITFLLPKRKDLPDIVTSGLPDVAIRIPSHPLLLELLNIINFPIAAPSANIFGHVSPTTAQHVSKQLGDRIPYILDGGTCKIGIESTIIGVQNYKAVLYRSGAITREEIEDCIGEISVNHSKKIVAPGMLESHYAPLTPLIVTDDVASVLKITGIDNIGLITYDEYSDLIPIEQQMLLCRSGDLSEASRNLYSAFHSMDECGYTTIIAKRLPDYGIGKAINDRMYRAAIKSF